jgi:predicted transcriptional regulator
MKPEIIAIVLLSLLSLWGIASAVILRSKNKKLQQKLSQIEGNENQAFVKFLSESREWAFQYIEHVQATLTKFNEVYSKELRYVKTYGSVMLDKTLSSIFEKIDEAYKDVKKLLPEDENKDKVK